MDETKDLEKGLFESSVAPRADRQEPQVDKARVLVIAFGVFACLLVGAIFFLGNGETAVACAPSFFSWARERYVNSFCKEEPEIKTPAWKSLAWARSLSRGGKVDHLVENKILEPPASEYKTLEDVAQATNNLQYGPVNGRMTRLKNEQDRKLTVMSAVGGGKGVVVLTPAGKIITSFDPNKPAELKRAYSDLFLEFLGSVSSSCWKQFLELNPRVKSVALEFADGTTVTDLRDALNRLIRDNKELDFFVETDLFAAYREALEERNLKLTTQQMMDQFVGAGSPEPKKQEQPQLGQRNLDDLQKKRPKVFGKLLERYLKKLRPLTNGLSTEDAKDTPARLNAIHSVFDGCIRKLRSVLLKYGHDLKTRVSYDFTDLPVEPSASAPPKKVSVEKNLAAKALKPEGWSELSSRLNAAQDRADEEGMLTKFAELTEIYESERELACFRVLLINWSLMRESQRSAFAWLTPLPEDEESDFPLDTDEESDFPLDTDGIHLRIQ